MLAEDDEGRFLQTPLSEVLRADAMPSLKGVATFFSDEWHVRAWEQLVEVVRTGRPAIDLVYGVPFFEYVTKHPGYAANFFLGMTNLSSIEGPAVAEAYDFKEIKRI